MTSPAENAVSFRQIIFNFLQRYLFWLKIGVSAAVLFYLWNRLQTEGYPLQQLPDRLFQSDGRLVFLAVALWPFNIGLEALKWRYLVRRYYPELTVWQAAKAVLIGAATGVITPNRIGEYAGRAMSLASGRRFEAAVATLVDRLSQMAITLLAGALGLVYLYFQAPNAVYLYVAFGSVLVLALGLLAAVYRPVILPRKLLRFGQNYQRRATETLKQIALVDIGVALLYAALRYAAFTAQYALLLFAFGYTGEIILGLSLIGAVFLFKSVTPSIALTELGLRESIAITVMGWFGVAVSAVFHATFALFLLNLLAPALVGSVFLVRSRS